MRDKRSLQFGEHNSGDPLDTRLGDSSTEKKNAVSVDNMTAYKTSRGTAPGHAAGGAVG